MLDPTDQTLVLLSEAKRRLPNGRGRGQMRRYRLQGARNILTGETVTLECVWLPGGWATSPAAWERFLLALNGRHPAGTG